MQRLRTITGSCLTVLATTALATVAQAATAALDPDFDGDGAHVLAGGYWPVEAVAIDAEQRIVVAANEGSSGTVLLRFLTDGSLDPAFAGGGIASDDFLQPEAHGLAIRDDGSLLLAGRRLNRFLVSAWEPGGTLRTEFGSNGYATLRVTNFSQDVGAAVVVQSTGRIVVAGYSSWSAQTVVDFAVVGFEADGDLASSFGAKGRTLTDFDLGADYAVAMALQDGDALMVAGHSKPLNAPYDSFALARYTADGELDTGFGSGGLVRTDFPAAGVNDEARAVAIQNNGFIVAGGLSGNDCALARYEPDGDLDPGFGDGGLVTTDLGTNAVGNVGCEIEGIAIDGQGRIVAVGRTVPAGGDDDFVLLRYEPDGELDAGFAGGIVTTDVTGTGTNDVAKGVAIDGEGRIVAAGETTVAEVGFTTAVARYRVPEAEGSLATLAALLTALSLRAGRRAAASRVPHFRPPG